VAIAKNYLKEEEFLFGGFFGDVFGWAGVYFAELYFWHIEKIDVLVNLIQFAEGFLINIERH
jgi:hypothetical protein